MCSVCVPQMKRTLAMPKPHSCRAARGRGDDVGVVGQAEVVVGAEVERLGLRRRDVRGLRRGQLALVLVQTRPPRISVSVAVSSSLNVPYIGLPSLGWGLEVGQGKGVRSSRGRPCRTAPDRAAAKASCHCSAGKRWVMTELTAVAQALARLQHRAHGVPGVVHLAAVDALDGDHVGDDPAPVDRERVLGQPEHRDAAAVVQVGEHVLHGLGAAATSPGRCRSPPACRARRCASRDAGRARR